MLLFHDFFFAFNLDADTSSRPSSTEPHSLDNNSSLRRACSLSDLNRPAVTKRLLPAPPTSGKYFSFHEIFYLDHPVDQNV